MADLTTTYMGMSLRSPVVVGASTFSRKTDRIKQADESGAGALVIHSLFQEQIELEAFELEQALNIGADHFAESLTYFPRLEHAGPREHVMWVEKARKAVGMPLFGSVNATSVGAWTDYARHLENAGCDGLELNIYSVETNPARSGADVEQQALDVVAAVKSAVKIPVAVKLSPYYSSLANFATRVVETGADALVLFNRFYQPTIDVGSEALAINLDLSTPHESRLPLRWIAILSGELRADLAASTGVHSGEDVARFILAGASAVQCVSALYSRGLGHVAVMNRELAEWMDAKGHKRIDDFRGKISRIKVSDPYAFERAQYIKLLLGQDPAQAAG